MSANSYRLVGYFPSYAIHARNFHVADIPGALLTHVVYAFAQVTADGVCASVKPKDDQVNFPQLLALKQQYPQLMTLISIGGASNSGNFPSAAATDASRQSLAQSCIAFMKQNGFDGLDIDWEFPEAADKANYAALLIELRRQLDAQGSADGRSYLLTIAAPASASHYVNLALDQVQTSVDWINLMAYDFYVATSPVTDFDAPLYLPTDDPGAVGTRLGYNVDAAVKAYLAAGVPAGKLVVGTHFEGTGWQGVPNTNNGLYQPNIGPANGTWGAGSFDYKDLAQNYLPSYSRFWHDIAQVPWLYNSTTGIMISYDDPQSLSLKAGYVVDNALGGIMIWQLSADNEEHSLLNAIAQVLG
jgi:chitinase